MKSLMTTLLLVAYLTAGVVGMQMMAGSLARLTGFERLRSPRGGIVRHSLTTAGSVVLLLAGLFLAIQAAVVIVWTLS